MTKDCILTLHVNVIELWRQNTSMKGAAPLACANSVGNTTRQRGHGLVRCVGYWALLWEGIWSPLVECCTILLISQYMLRSHSRIRVALSTIVALSLSLLCTIQSHSSMHSPCKNNFLSLPTEERYYASCPRVCDKQWNWDTCLYTVGQNGQIPPLAKIFSNIPPFERYLAIYHIFKTQVP